MRLRLSLALLLIAVAAFVVVCQPLPAPVPPAATPAKIANVRLQDFSRRFPQEGPFMSPTPAVLPLVVCRKPVAFSMQPERDDALNYLNAYVVETLECGHEVNQHFNPPLENLIAKRRRCLQCDQRQIDEPQVKRVLEFPSPQKKPEKIAA